MKHAEGLDRAGLPGGQPNPTSVDPPNLQEMQSCVPGPGLLPGLDDPDGVQWIRAVGPTRADLQLYALNLLWEVEFLLPTHAGDHWMKTKKDLADLLATPGLNNLREAKSLLRRSAENITEDKVVDALEKGNADITMDPAIPRPNQRIRFSVRFRDARFNVAAARDLVTCHWTFSDRRPWSLRGALHRRFEKLRGLVWGDDLRAPEKPLGEEGWAVHHYFEGDIQRSDISVKFSRSNGAYVILPPPATTGEGVWHIKSEPVDRSRRSREGWQRFWIEALQLGAALLAPLATLASQTVHDASATNWWQLVVIGFASDTIKGILVGQPAASRPGAK